MRGTVLALALIACSGGVGSDDSGAPPAGCVEEGGACVLQGDILDDTTLTADRAWLLRSGVRVGDDASEVTLTIEPGTTIYGESATSGFLVITRGARIHAEGTAEAPIRFTSDQPEGSRARGDWGGLILNGRARINACAADVDPCEAEGEGGTGTYGGSDDADDSGVLKYVVIEYGGTEISPDNEINGLGLQAVGSGTEIDHVQIHRNLDDGIEFWGGTVGVKHLLVTGVGDDAIDWDLGWRGKIQFAVVEQATDAGNNGSECDNNESDHLAAPVSNPTLANVTFLGAPGIAEDNYAMLFRHGAAPRYHNVAAAGFSAGCLAIRDPATFDRFADGQAAITHTVLGCAVPFEDTADEAVFQDGEGNRLVDDLGLEGRAPSAGSPLLGAGRGLDDPWFDPVDFVGGVGADDWTAGWTVSSTN